jgi:hypothetical protein
MSRCRRTRAKRRRWTELLRFSDEQLRIIQDAARSVPVHRRTDYLLAIAADLLRLAQFSDDDVLGACQRASAVWRVVGNPPKSGGKSTSAGAAP